ncbi:hypothetical protein [Streptomyces flaveolus]|uniref:hypothetical protein n=1 Tax=Streptomyces flaveolus TaxID=67297 RepID=UPI00382C6F9C
MTAAVGPDETFDWLTSCADHRGEEGDPDQRSAVAEPLRIAGRTDEAPAWLGRVSQTGALTPGVSSPNRRQRPVAWEPCGETSKPWRVAPQAYSASVSGSPDVAQSLN